MLYELKNLVKRYEERKVLDIDNLSIEKGSVYGLLGPNGAGKTTLLEIFAFILRPDEGELYFCDNTVHYTNSDLHSYRKRVVLVQQHPVLFTTTIFKNVEFPLKIRKIEKAKRQNSVEELLSLVGMTAFRGSLGHTLSGGETQRVAIAQALACSPDVILLDEPTSSVDIENRAGIENIIRRINREKGISILFTSHDMLQVKRIADKIIYINNGRVSDSIHENIFNGVIVESGNIKYVEIQDEVRFPVDTDRQGEVRVSVNPMKMKIKKNSELKDSQVKGRLIQLTDEGDRIRVIVDLNISLILLMEKEKYLISDFNIGDTVTIECPKDSIQFI